VIKAPTATAVSPQTYTGSGQAATVTFKFSTWSGSNILQEQLLKLMQRLMGYSNFVPTDTANYNSLALSAGFCDW
jgi:hypothetical protein